MPGLFLPLLLATTLAPGQLEPAPADPPSQIAADSEQPGEKKRMEPRRTGLLVAVGGGYLGCRTAYCQDVFRGAFAMEAELG